MAWNIELPDAECYALSDAIRGDIPGISRFNDGLVREVLDQKELGIDTETTGLVVWKDQPLFWSLSWGERRICMPQDTLPYFKRAFADSDKKWIFANAKFDAHMLANVGIDFAGKLVDTQVMHAFLYEDQSHALKDMAKNVLGWRWTDFEDTFGRIPEDGPGPMLLKWWEEQPTKLVDYASNDAYGTYKLYLKLKKELEAAYTHSLYPDIYATLADIFWKIEVPFTRVLYDCERAGVLIDKAKLEATRGPMETELENIEREINKAAGRRLNPQSPDQLRAYFVDECKLMPLTYTKGGKKGIRQASVDAGFLERYEDEHPVAALCLKHRDLSKSLGTYVDGLIKRLDPYSRVHTRFNQFPRTGRLGSSDPNIQNVPRAGQDRFKIRGAFIAPPGKKLIVADYEQLEMRLLAAASGEQDMIDVIRRGWDIHMGNAALVFGSSVAQHHGRAEPYGYDDFKNAKNIDKKVKAQELPISALTDIIQDLMIARENVKTIGFGLNYGMKENKLARSLKCTKEEALALMKQYLARYPAIDRYFKETIAIAQRTGYAFTVLGRRRFIPEIASMNDMDRWQAERQASNTGIQGSAADVVKMAMILCHQDPYLTKECGARMLIQVHDELMFEVPEETVQQAKASIKDWMEHPFPTDLEVPLDISAGVGHSWIDAK
jgi:DNA polymerase-1